jgi:hypothetical protein
MSVPSLSEPYMVACSMRWLVLWSSGNRNMSFQAHLGFSSLPAIQQDMKPKQLPIPGQTQICMRLLPTNCMYLEVEASVSPEDAGFQPRCHLHLQRKHITHAARAQTVPKKIKVPFRVFHFLMHALAIRSPATKPKESAIINHVLDHGPSSVATLYHGMRNCSCAFVRSGFERRGRHPYTHRCSLAKECSQEYLPPG